MMAFCLCPITKHGPGLVQLRKPDFALFLMRHFTALNELTEMYSLDERENDRITRQVDAYFLQHTAR